MNFKHGKCLKQYYCKDCNKEISIISGIYGQGRCKSCSRKGNKHWCFGKFFSKKHKKNISLNHANVKEKKNGNYKHGQTLKQHYCKQCQRIICYNTYKSGSGLCNYCARKGKKCYWYGKVPHGKWGIYKGINMRSSWEVKFAQFLDLSGIKYQYEPKAFDLGNTTYRPDFYIPQWDLYIEIKGYWRIDAKIKFKLFKKQYSKINIKIFNKEKLQIIGVL